METDELLNILKRDPPRYAWAIQDLALWPERCKIFSTGSNDRDFAFIDISGHPACRECPAVIAGGNPEHAPALLSNLPKQPFVIRETPITWSVPIASATPNGKIYLEQRMQTDRAAFKARHQGRARRLTAEDVGKLCEFYDSPPQAAFGYKMWVSNAVVYGVFAGSKLVALGSTIVKLPDVWVLVSIETHPEHRRKGFGREVTSALTAEALEAVPCVSLTVLKTNTAAINLYTGLGFKYAEDRIWVDCGANFAP